MMRDDTFDADAFIAEMAALCAPPDHEVDPSWRRVDLESALAGNIVRALPNVLRREDGNCLFYPRRVNGLHADSGIGKSMVCGVAAAQELSAGTHVGWVDLEDPDATTIVERLRMFGVSDETIRERVHYFSPREPFTDAAIAMLCAEAIEYPITLFVIDSVGEAFGLEGLDENKDAEVGPWTRRVARVLADAGPAVVLVDHATKAADNPLHPSGSKRKRAAITGASYLVEATQPLTREQGGKLRLTCAKDRHGNYGRGNVVAMIDMSIDHDGSVSVKVWPPLPKGPAIGPEDQLSDIAKAAIQAVKNAGRSVSRRELEALMVVTAAASLKRAGIDHAVRKGALIVECGPRNAILHSYVHDMETADS